MAKEEIRERRAAALTGEFAQPDPDGHSVINRQRDAERRRHPLLLCAPSPRASRRETRLPGDSCRCRMMNRSIDAPALVRLANQQTQPFSASKNTNISQTHFFQAFENQSI
jgi:hypothetical protein